MGLNSFFYLKSRKDPKFEVVISYYRKFFELDEYVRGCAPIAKDENGEFKDNVFDIDYEFLRGLKAELQPVVDILNRIPERLIHKYDDHNHYPDKYKLNSEELIVEDFNPIMSGSAFAGSKTLRLYYFVRWALDFMDDQDYKDEYYIEYISS